MNIIWSSAALSDLQHAVAEAMERDLDWADAILAETQRIEDLLRRHPNAGPRVPGAGNRKLGLGRLPFILIYHVEGNAVSILRLRHAASDWRP